MGARTQIRAPRGYRKSGTGTGTFTGRQSRGAAPLKTLFPNIDRYFWDATLALCVIALAWVTSACAPEATLLTARDETPAQEAKKPCPQGMVVNGATCIDAFEAHLEEIDEAGVVVRVYPPNKSPPLSAKPALRLRAKSSLGVLPQAHIPQRDALAACHLAGKRLCTKQEWLAACRGPSNTAYPHGSRERAGACNDRGVEVLAAIFKQPSAPDTWGFDPMNDPRLHLVPGGPSRTGRFTQCASEVGAFDMVGNLHEWIDDPDGTMLGGFYLDTRTLGEGCNYGTTGHDQHYRDYSTGFRCCQDR